eukprot:894890-Amphidinium_carterae.1
MQKSLLDYGRAVPKAVSPAGEEELARRSSFSRSELARLGLDGSSQKRPRRPRRQLHYEQELVKALQNDPECLTELTSKEVPVWWRLGGPLLQPPAHVSEEAHAAPDAEDDPVVLDHAEERETEEQFQATHGCATTCTTSVSSSKQDPHKLLEKTGGMRQE